LEKEFMALIHLKDYPKTGKRAMKEVTSKWRSFQ
jgi:hypothetical protein